MIALLVQVAMAGIRFETPASVGTEVIIVVDRDGTPGRGETVRVVHRPGTAHERERAIGITDGRGRVSWTPEEGGVAEVRAGDEILAMHVAYDAVPTTTATVLGLLGVTALGLGITGLLRRTRKPSRRRAT
ncbi:MAG: hypothetical protein R3F61_16835 [Myxococcota bacterium]